MQPTPQAFCTDCHGTLKDRLKDTKLGDAADFGTSHPQFSALVQTRPGKHPRFTRASLGSRPMDDGGLKFPHDIHLSATGGVAKMAWTMKAQYGFGDALACRSEEHTSELQSLMRISYAVFCLKNKTISYKVHS